MLTTRTGFLNGVSEVRFLPGAPSPWGAHPRTRRRLESPFCVVIGCSRRGWRLNRDDPSYRGQRGYNRFLLAIYDPWVLGFMARAVWKSPIPPVVERYRRLMGRRHLDVGPGTGYFLERAAPSEETEITLLDPNPNVLKRASRRLAARKPITVEADVMK